MNGNMVSNNLYMQYINSEIPRLQEMKPIDRGKEVLTFQPDNSVVIKVEPELPGAFFNKEDEKEQCLAQKIDRNFMIPPDIRLPSFPKFEQPYYFPYDMQCPRPVNFDHGPCVNWNEQFFGKSTGISVLSDLTGVLNMRCPVLPPDSDVAAISVDATMQQMCQDPPSTVPESEGVNCHRPREPDPTDFCPAPVETESHQPAHSTPKRRNARKTSETPERRAARLAAAAERERRRRANETEEQRRVRREANARRSRLRRANEPEHLRRARLEANARRARMRRAAAAAAAATVVATTVSSAAVPPSVSSTAVPDVTANTSITLGTTAPVATETTTVTEVAALGTNISHPVVPVPPTNVPSLDGFSSLLCTDQNST